MDLVEVREQKRQRTVTSCHILVDAVEEGQQQKHGNLGKPNDDLETRVLLTDAAADYDDEEIEGEYAVYCSRVAFMTRRPGFQDEIDWAVAQYKCSVPRTSLFTYFEEGEWSLTGTLVQLVSVKIIEGAGKYLFGKILAVNYRKEFLSFYSRESNDYEICDEKAIVSLSSPHRVFQILDELDIYVNLSTKDSEDSEEREIGRGVISWQGLEPRPGIFTDLVHGRDAVTKVTYAVIDNAVEAVVGISITGRSVKNLRAKIVAINEMFGKVVLFDGILGDTLLEKEFIPLNNHVLAVSKQEGQKLEIRVLLGDDKTAKIIRHAIFIPKFL
ncbi:unnamed protein product [Urochloa humidicola]